MCVCIQLLAGEAMDHCSGGTSGPSCRHRINHSWGVVADIVFLLVVMNICVRLPRMGNTEYGGRAFVLCHDDIVLLDEHCRRGCGGVSSC